MSDNCNQQNKDCDECQKTLKDHLRQCAGYGNNPKLIEKCEELPGACSVGKPDCCPAPPPECPKPCAEPPKCDIPVTACFKCPVSDCDAKVACPPPAPKCCPPTHKVEQCPPKKADSCGAPKKDCPAKKNDNSCDARPLGVGK